MINQRHCGEVTIEIEDEAKKKLLAAVGDPLVDFFQVDYDFCAQPELQAYIQRNAYNVHPCAELLNVQRRNTVCGIFTAIAPPPYEVRLAKFC